MAFTTILLPFLCFLVSSTAKQNCSECSLFPVGEDLSSEFQLKASEKGVKLVYLQVKITRNDSYSPLNVQDEFLPDWWVYTRSISEPMLSLPYDYDALSLGLLNYQERSMIVPLKENRAECLVPLNSSCQNKVIGSALLKNVTISIHKEGVVCVQDVKDYSLFQLLYYGHNLKYDCCIREKNSVGIRCNQSVRTTVWLDAFNAALFMLQLVLVLYFPAFPLALPDFIFNFQEELEKEQQEDEKLKNELDRNRRGLDANSQDSHDNQGQELQDPHYYQRDSTAEGDQNLYPEPEISVIIDDGSPFSCCRRSDTNIPDRSEYEQFDTSDHADNQRQDPQDGRDDHDQPESGRGAGGDQHPSEQMLVYMDDSSPTTCCNLLRRVISSNYSGSLRHLKFSFNIKLVFLVFGVAPTFLYLRLLLLVLTIKRRVFDETAAKKKASLDGVHLFSKEFFYLVTAFDIFTLIFTVSVPLVAVLISRPQDFLLDGTCRICGEHFSSVGIGEDMRKHIEDWQLNLRRFVMWIFKTHSSIITWAIECTACVLRHIKPSGRLKRSLVKAGYVPVYTIILTIFGVVLGVFGLFILLVGFILATMWYSPLVCVLNIAYRRMYGAYMLLATSSFRIIIGKGIRTVFPIFVVLGPILALAAVVVLTIIAIFIFFLPIYWLYLPCFFVLISARFLVRTFGLTIMGLVFNREILSNFLAFLVAAVTNLLLCYYIFQNAYKEIKEMIFKYRQKHRPQNCSMDTGKEDSFPEKLFWSVIDDHRVLPIIPEFYRMLRKMALILIFVFLAFCSAILFSDPHDFGAAYLTIYLFATGAIAGLVFKGMTIGKRFTGARKQKIEKQIEDAVISFYGRCREVVVHIYTHV